MAQGLSTLSIPQVIRFVISNNETFAQATKFTKGAIIESAFTKCLTNNGISNVDKFTQTILKNED
jgi:tryptophan synthase alpha chain